MKKLLSQKFVEKPQAPRWILFLKILSYIISLILGGVVTSCAPLVL